MQEKNWKCEESAAEREIADLIQFHDCKCKAENFCQRFKEKLEAAAHQHTSTHHQTHMYM